MNNSKPLLKHVFVSFPLSQILCLAFNLGIVMFERNREDDTHEECQSACAFINFKGIYWHLSPFITASAVTTCRLVNRCFA